MASVQLDVSLMLRKRVVSWTRHGTRAGHSAVGEGGAKVVGRRAGDVGYIVVWPCRRASVQRGRVGMGEEAPMERRRWRLRPERGREGQKRGGV